MDYNEIKKLMDDMGDSKLNSLEIEFPDGIKISMTKGRKDHHPHHPICNHHGDIIEGSAPMTVPTVVENTERSVVIKSECNNNCKGEDENLKIIKSPMVGTFYSRPTPDKDDFVKVGDKVKKGQIVCIVEAMKLMNEIESEFDGEIVEICTCNEKMVEYGSPLFKIK